MNWNCIEMPSINKTHILVVDDDPDIREMLALLFETEGAASVKTAANGTEALDKLESFTEPHVVFLDLMMPICNGWDFLELVRASSDLQQHRIGIMSASRPEAQELKGYAFFAKPLDLVALIDFAQS
jgi:CheY-like chemotaxis protein